MLLELENELVDTAAEHAPQVPPFAAMMQLLFGKHITYAVSAIARLGVADHIGGTAVPVAELAAAVGAHEPSLYRVLRTLASVGVFFETPLGHFQLTPMGELLKTNAPNSVRFSAMQFGDPWSTRAFEFLTDTIRTGEDAIHKAYGKNVFEVFAEDPQAAETFNRSMTAFSSNLAEPIAAAYPFGSISRLADVGGGHGMLLSYLLRRNPRMTGVLYDLPEVVADAMNQPHFDSMQDRVSVQPGNFFEEVPEGCDAYLMKSILHDWSDDHCRTILKAIRKQMRPGSKLLVCELLVETDGKPSFAKMLDLEMLTMTVGGRERTVSEFAELFASVGLRLTKVVTTTSPMAVIEAQLA
jgi:hypothetical protein